MRAAPVLDVPLLSRADGDLLAGLGPAWTRIDHVPFGATADVEHVLLAEVGVVVVTTMDDDEELTHALSVARHRARCVMSLVRPVQWVAAVPVLVASGLAELEIAGGHEWRDGILVVRTIDPLTWVDALEGRDAVLHADRIGEMVDVLVAHTQRTDAILGTYDTPRPFCR